MPLSTALWQILGIMDLGNNNSGNSGRVRKDIRSHGIDIGELPHGKTCDHKLYSVHKIIQKAMG